MKAIYLLKGKDSELIPDFNSGKTAGKGGRRGNVCPNGQKELKSFPHNGLKAPLMTIASHHALHPDPDHTPVSLQDMFTHTITPRWQSVCHHPPPHGC